VKSIISKKIMVPQMRRVELLFPEPAILIGGIDFVANIDRKGSALASENRLITPSGASTKPKTLAINPYYCILPTQWNIPSIDNYGFSHPADRSNVIKTLLATQTLGAGAQTGVSLGSSSGLLGKALSGIASTSIGLGQKF